MSAERKDAEENSRHPGFRQRIGTAFRSSTFGYYWQEVTDRLDSARYADARLLVNQEVIPEMNRALDDLDTEAKAERRYHATAQLCRLMKVITTGDQITKARQLCIGPEAQGSASAAVLVPVHEALYERVADPDSPIKANHLTSYAKSGVRGKDTTPERRTTLPMWLGGTLILSHRLHALTGYLAKTGEIRPPKLISVADQMESWEPGQGDRETLEEAIYRVNRREQENYTEQKERQEKVAEELSEAILGGCLSIRALMERGQGDRALAEALLLTMTRCLSPAAYEDWFAIAESSLLSEIVDRAERKGSADSPRFLDQETGPRGGKEGMFSDRGLVTPLLAKDEMFAINAGVYEELALRKVRVHREDDHVGTKHELEIEAELLGRDDLDLQPAYQKVRYFEDLTRLDADVWDKNRQGVFGTDPEGLGNLDRAPGHFAQLLGELALEAGETTHRVMALHLLTLLSIERPGENDAYGYKDAFRRVLTQIAPQLYFSRNEKAGDGRVGPSCPALVELRAACELAFKTTVRTWSNQEPFFRRLSQLADKDDAYDLKSPFARDLKRLLLLVCKGGDHDDLPQSFTKGAETADQVMGLMTNYLTRGDRNYRAFDLDQVLEVAGADLKPVVNDEDAFCLQGTPEPRGAAAARWALGFSAHFKQAEGTEGFNQLRDQVGRLVAERLTGDFIREIAGPEVSLDAGLCARVLVGYGNKLMGQIRQVLEETTDSEEIRERLAGDLQEIGHLVTGQVRSIQTTMGELLKPEDEEDPMARMIEVVRGMMPGVSLGGRTETGDEIPQTFGQTPANIPILELSYIQAQQESARMQAVHAVIDTMTTMMEASGDLMRNRSRAEAAVEMMKVLRQLVTSVGTTTAETMQKLIRTEAERRGIMLGVIDAQDALDQKAVQSAIQLAEHLAAVRRERLDRYGEQLTVYERRTNRIDLGFQRLTGAPLEISLNSLRVDPLRSSLGVVEVREETSESVAGANIVAQPSEPDLSDAREAA